MPPLNFTGLSLWLSDSLGPAHVASLSSLIQERNGSIALWHQLPLITPFFLISDDIHEPRTFKIIRARQYTILKSTWLKDCIDQDTVVPISPAHILARPSTYFSLEEKATPQSLPPPSTPKPAPPPPGSAAKKPRPDNASEVPWSKHHDKLLKAWAQSHGPERARFESLLLGTGKTPQDLQARCEALRL